MPRLLSQLVPALVLALVGATTSSTLVSPPATAAVTVAASSTQADEEFFSWTDADALAAARPGDVLRTRTVPYHLVGLRTPVQVVQLLYRTVDAQGEPSANATSIVLPPQGGTRSRAVAYQSFYDSLDPADSPSRVFAGDVSFGGLVANVETVFLVPLLAQGYPVIVADTQGPTANFAAGPEYGTTTLDSIRAARSSSATGLSTDTQVALLGYSGGAIGTNWAAALAPTYAPDVNGDLVGAASGGLLVAPAHNLEYVSGTPIWSGVAGMAVVGLSRAYGVDLSPYLNDYGRRVLTRLEDASIVNALGQYPGLTWQKLVKPQYADPRSIPEIVAALNATNLGARPAPTVPLLLAQGTGGYLEGSSGLRPGIGAGDGVMIAGDVRTLARQYCAAGTRVSHAEYPLLSHAPTALAWAPGALAWIEGRFAGRQAPSNCSSIRPGNSLAPETVVPVGAGAR